MLNLEKTFKKVTSSALAVALLSQSFCPTEAKSFAENKIPQNSKVIKTTSKNNLSFKEKLAKYLLGIGVPVGVVALITGLTLFTVSKLKNKNPNPKQLKQQQKESEEEEKKEEEVKEEQPKGEEENKDEQQEPENEENSKSSSEESEEEEKKEEEVKEEQQESENEEISESSSEDDSSEEEPENEKNTLIITANDVEELTFAELFTRNSIDPFEIKPDNQAARQILLAFADKIQGYDKFNEIKNNSAKKKEYALKEDKLEEWERNIIDNEYIKVRALTEEKLKSALKNRYKHNIEDIEDIEFKEDCKVEAFCKYDFSFSSITNVTIPKNVKFVGYACFRYCEELTTVEFEGEPDKMYIDTQIFDQCEKLSKVIVPQGTNSGFVVEENTKNGDITIEERLKGKSYFNPANLKFEIGYMENGKFVKMNQKQK